MRIEGDTKDVSASQNTNNAHNLKFTGSHQNSMPQPAINQASNFREHDLTKCKIHKNEDIKAFCKTCLQSICFKCLLGDHRNCEDVVMLEDLKIDDLQE